MEGGSPRVRPGLGNHGLVFESPTDAEWADGRAGQSGTRGVQTTSPETAGGAEAVGEVTVRAIKEACMGEAIRGKDSPEAAFSECAPPSSASCSPSAAAGAAFPPRS